MLTQTFELKAIANKLNMTTNDFSKIINNTPQALNMLKKSNPEKYTIMTLGMFAKKLDITYDDLLAISTLKNTVEKNMGKKS